MIFLHHHKGMVKHSFVQADLMKVPILLMPLLATRTVVSILLLGWILSATMGPKICCRLPSGFSLMIHTKFMFSMKLLKKSFF